MSENGDNNLDNINQDERISIRTQVENYLRYWKWFVLAVIISLAYSFYQIRKTIPQFEITSSILIKDNSQSASELDVFQDLGVISDTKSGVEDEIEILRSRTLMQRVVKELDLNINYVSKGYLRTKELYKNTPVTIEFLNDSIMENRYANISIFIHSPTEFSVIKDGEPGPKLFKFDKWQELGVGSVKLNVSSNISQFIDRELSINIRPIANTVNSYINQVNIFFPSKTSRVIHLKMTSANKQMAKDIIDNLIKQYNNDALNDKNQISQNTADFIDLRLELIDKDLFGVEKNVEEYKQNNNIVDLGAETGIFLSGSSENKQKQIDLETELKLVDYMMDYIDDDELKLIPAKIGITDPVTQETINQYNELLLRRNQALESVSVQNPVIINLTSQLGVLKNNLRKSVANLKGSLDISLANLNRQQSQFQTGLSSIPTKERQYREIERQQNIKESLYLYLLQKKEETAISLAGSVANAKIIDRAYDSLSPVSPNKRAAYTKAILYGLIVPFIIIFTKNLLDTKVRESKDIEVRLKRPILGEIPKNVNKEHYIVKENDQSVFAESFRLLDTNLEFLLADNEKDCKTILISSTISKEGKTSISINSGLTLAYSGSKVLLMEMDLRAPKVQQYLGMNRDKGITNFVKDRDLELEDITRVSELSENFHVIPSGDIPPNPTDILKTDRLKQLISLAQEKYDYVIIDTAPVSLVPDTLLLSHFADLCIYVVRANYLDKRMLKYPQMLIKEKRFENVVFVVNSVTQNKGYGYGYGYGYGQEIPLPWYRKLLKKVS